VSPASKTEEARRPGRPRSARADAAIVSATLDLLFRRGFAGLSVEEVAKRAGVSKATIYRRFPSKVDLVISSIRWLGLPEGEEPLDTGSFRGDFEAIGAQIAADRKRTGVSGLTMPRLVSEALATDPDLFEVLQERLIEPRVGAVKAVVRRAVERGELRADLDVEAATDALMGSLTFLMLRTGRSWEEFEEEPNRHIDLLLVGLAAPGPPG
jgi:AcrR family transcriptional regulator